MSREWWAEISISESPIEFLIGDLGKKKKKTFVLTMYLMSIPKSHETLKYKFHCQALQYKLQLPLFFVKAPLPFLS